MDNSIQRSKSRMLLIEEKYSALWNKEVTLRDVLYKFYIEDKMSMEQIGEEIHCSRSLICRWMKDFGVPARKLNWQ